jgi:hypothetical protein
LAGIKRLRPRIAQRRIKLSLLRIDETAGLPLAVDETSRIVADSIRWRHHAVTLRNRRHLKSLHIGVEPNLGASNPLRVRSAE